MPANPIHKPSPPIAITTNIDEHTMQTATHHLAEETSKIELRLSVTDWVKQSFNKIAPFWPLKNLIAVNPLQGFEEWPIETAFKMATAYFQPTALPQPMEAINRDTIKWLQAYCDEGQANISMPLRQQGLYAAWRQLVIYDRRLPRGDKQARQWLQNLPNNAPQAIEECLSRLGIQNDDNVTFLTLLLTTLPGWAAYIKYRTEWAGEDSFQAYPITQADYLAVRLIMTCLHWPEAKALLIWHQQCLQTVTEPPIALAHIERYEQNHHLPLLKKLARQPLKANNTPKAQWVFCIDVRSEPFRRALETIGSYQTFGLAGFFGLAIQITDTVTGDSYPSCPVLLSPKHTVNASPCRASKAKPAYPGRSGFKKLYQSLKYTFTTPFALAETMGLASGAWMALQCFAPGFAAKLKNRVINTVQKPDSVQLSLVNMTVTEQSAYAEQALKLIGLTHGFATRVVFCGHGSTSQNNAYATALDCGACGGRHGGHNARVLAAILNRSEVRLQLAAQGIVIPPTTHFMAAEHNTTTDQVTLYDAATDAMTLQLQHDLEQARAIASTRRAKTLGKNCPTPPAADHTYARAQDWGQVRPEWGLARNAAFCIGPRHLTQALDLEGRVFLHSYDWQQDPSGESLSMILTAPMVVAQWINCQYLFSTLDNVAFGSGSKITHNITGKIGVMQGNASDLMTGLPLQSVYSGDTHRYHQPMRLLTVVFAPRVMITAVIDTHRILQKLFGHGWVKLACIEPKDRSIYLLARELTWQKIL